MKVLVIGRTGFVGPRVVTRLSLLGHQVVARDEALRRTVAWEREHPPTGAPSADELAERFRVEDELLAGTARSR